MVQRRGTFLLVSTALACLGCHFSTKLTNLVTLHKDSKNTLSMYSPPCQGRFDHLEQAVQHRKQRQAIAYSLSPVSSPSLQVFMALKSEQWGSMLFCHQSLSGGTTLLKSTLINKEHVEEAMFTSESTLFLFLIGLYDFIVETKLITDLDSTWQDQRVYGDFRRKALEASRLWMSVDQKHCTIKSKADAESMTYYAENFDRITDPDYKPTTRDMLKAYQKITDSSKLRIAGRKMIWQSMDQESPPFTPYGSIEAFDVAQVVIFTLSIERVANQRSIFGSAWLQSQGYAVEAIAEHSKCKGIILAFDQSDWWEGRLSTPWAVLDPLADIFKSVASNKSAAFRLMFINMRHFRFRAQRKILEAAESMVEGVSFSGRP